MVSRQRLGATAAVFAAFLLGVGFWAAVDRSLWATAIATGLLAVLAALPALGRLSRIWSLPGIAAPPYGADDRHAGEARRRWLAHVLDLVPTALVSRSGDGRLTALNRSSRALFATDGAIVDASDDLVRVAAGPLAATAAPLHLGAPSARAYAVSMAEIMQDDGPARLIALADIEEQLQAREAATLKDTLDVLSHEIMNSLTPVTSLAQSARALLAEGDPDRAGDALATLERRASGLLRFVDSYRALTRLPAPDLRPVSVGQLLGDVQGLFESHEWMAGGVLDVSPAPDGVVMGDPDLLAQALINLLLNAAEAALALPVDATRPARVRLSVERQGDAMTFRVSDNGPGLGALDPETVLKPFFTTRPGGAGIGLSLVRQIVSNHDSRLDFGESDLGPTGLTVGFSLATPRPPGSD
jgi:nitrogen fixation/metabolism regulation signal transduction histidine kinase